MKLLCVQQQFVDSGKANVIQISHMCAAFAELGIDVTIAVPTNGMNAAEIMAKYEKILDKKANFKVVTYDKRYFFGRFSAVGTYFSIRKLIKHVEVTHCYIRNSLLISIMLRNKIDVIYEAHNSRIHDNHLLNILLSANLIRMSRKSGIASFVSISQALGDYWVNRGVPKEKSIVLHDAVDTVAYEKIPDKNSLRCKLNLPIKMKIVAYTGSLYADRDIVKILELSRLNPNVFFLVVGGPKQVATEFTSQAIAQNLNNVMFVGPVGHAEVKTYLFASDILLMIWSNRVRTMNYCSPLKVFEYMAAGKIIVGHGFQTIHEVLTDGENALLADPDSFGELCDKLDEAIGMPEVNSLSKASRKLAFEKYSWNSRALEILEFVKSDYQHKLNPNVKKS
ncbi:MAG: glycosyltransferase involved in cell wall biosynthesis [Glaciecola sp.]|jgi:glycosyltransferase involved in cell wall biosynthesis